VSPNSVPRKASATVVKNVRPPQTELRVIPDWFEELNSLVYTGKK
jgi:hypothetical protein